MGYQDTPSGSGTAMKDTQEELRCANKRKQGSAKGTQLVARTQKGSAGRMSKAQHVGPRAHMDQDERFKSGGKMSPSTLLGVRPTTGS